MTGTHTLDRRQRTATRWPGGAGLATLIALGACTWAAPHKSPAEVRFVTEDIDRFWEAWDAAQEVSDRAERVAIFQTLYLDPGTPGLHDWLKARIESPERLVDAIDAHPEYYAQLRRQTPHAAEAAEPVRAAFEELERRYPDAVFPDVYLLVGIMSSGGTTGPSGLLIGVEMYGRVADTPTHELGDWHLDVLRSMDVLPHIIAHELVHYQQPHQWGRSTLLANVLREGSADFVAELISGRHINDHVHEWALPREAEVWAHFAPLMNEKDGFHGFLYGGERPEGWPADVGYFIGYRIAQAYYERAEDPDRALAEILTLKGGDAERFLQESGYAERFPG